MSAVPSTYYRIDPAKMKAARRAAFLTQQALSEVSGVSFNSIQRIEQGGKRTPLGQRVSTVKCLANALGISPVDILWTSSPPGQSPGRESVNHSGERAEKERQTPTPIEISGTQVLDLGSALAVEPRTLNAESALDLKAPQAATTNGNGKYVNPLDALNLGLVEAMWSKHRGWDESVSFAYLHALTAGSEKRGIPAFGAKAVNAAIDDLYANAPSVADPAAYLRERAQSHTQGVSG